jgi:hypothetical protein
MLAFCPSFSSFCFISRLESEPLPAPLVAELLAPQFSFSTHHFWFAIRCCLHLPMILALMPPPSLLLPQPPPSYWCVRLNYLFVYFLSVEQLLATGAAMVLKRCTDQFCCCCNWWFRYCRGDLCMCYVILIITIAIIRCNASCIC